MRIVTKLTSFISLSFAVVLFGGTTDAQSVRMKDSSDWWSITNTSFQGPDIKPGRHEIESSNFALAGVRLRADGFGGLAIKMGKAPIVERGDGASGRQQVCYISPQASSMVHMVFEFGEDDSIFYLFTGGPNWRGSEYCVKSKRVSLTTSTSSGLRLGLTPDQVEVILGRPDATVGDTAVYSREFRKRATATQFERQRKEYPDKLSDSAAHEKFDFLPGAQYLVVRFANSKLFYLAVSTSDE